MQKDTEEVFTPITVAALLADGFVYKFDEIRLAGADPDEHDDPYYYYKGEFRVYDVIQDFYVHGHRITSMEKIRELYEAETGRRFNTFYVPEDTAPAEVNFTGTVDKNRFVKAKLRGGPGEGLTVKWPLNMPAFIYQTKSADGVTESFRYLRKKRTKGVFQYAGPVQ
jgi:hypothetical protein